MRRIMLAMVMLGSLAQPGFAQVPGTITFTARVVDNDVPINGPHAFTFRLFDAVTGGTQVWSEGYTGVSVNDGLVTVALGTMTPLTVSVLDGDPLWVEVAMDGSTMSPRLPVRSVPYAFRSGDAASVGGFAPTAFATSGHNHDPAYVNTTGDSMSGSLSVNGNFTLTGFGHFQAGGRFDGIAVGSAPFGSVSWPYETIQLDPAYNLRFYFGGTQQMALYNNGVLWMTATNGDCPSGWFCNGMFWDISVASMYYTGLAQRSDARLKKDIRALEGSLATIMALRPVSFEWRDASLPGRRYGFIAQEVQQVLPDLVSETDTGTLAVDTSSILPMVVEAVQELEAENERLRAEMTALRASGTAAPATARRDGLSAASLGIGAAIALAMFIAFTLGRRRTA